MKYLVISIIFLATNYTSAQTTSSNHYFKEDIKFNNGEILLHGEMYIPKGEGPFPTVIFTHGSGDAGVDNSRYQMEAEYFAKHGILSLVYDKRGYGKSTGNWRTSDYEALANDAVAAISALKSNSKVDTSKIGLRGISQSGWVLPIVAKKSSDVNFLILISPPGVTTYDQIIYDVRTDIEDLGYPPDEVEKALEVIKSGMEYAKTLDNWERHQKMLDKFSDKKWLSAAAGPPVQDHWLWSWVNPVLDFDAIPILKDSKASILIILGEKDRVIPAQIAGYRFEKELMKLENKYKIVYFPNAGHDMREANFEIPNEEPPLVKGYLELMKNWIVK